MDAVFDIGNTFTKIGFIEKGILSQKEVFSTFPFSNFYKYLNTASFKNGVLSSVVPLPGHLMRYISHKAKKIIMLNAEVILPVKLDYETPASLGNDRIALLCGAAALYTGKNVLIISAGSCITYNLLTAGNLFAGGAISPGLQMRLRAMHQMTAALPLVEISSDNIPLVAKSTNDSLLSGALNGAVLEIDGYINQLKHTIPDLEVLLCGGDSRYLSVHLKSAVRIEPDLAFTGLHKILTLNV